MILLANGADHVTTLDYMPITSHHPNLTAMTPFEMNSLYEKGALPEFDRVVSFSSLEHSGLGRYWDGINPFGDLIAMARAWCLSKVGVVLGVQ